MNFYSKINFHLPELQMWKHILKQAQPVKFFFKKFVSFYVFLVKLKEKESLIQFSQRSYSSFWKEYLLKPGGLRWVLVGIAPLRKFSGYEVIIIFNTKQQNTETRNERLWRSECGEDNF